MSEKKASNLTKMCLGLSCLEPGSPLKAYALVIQVGIIKIALLFFSHSLGMLVFLNQFSITRTARSCRTVDSNHDRQRAFYSFNTTVDVTFHLNLTIAYFQNFFCVCDLRQSQLFCYLRTYLCRVTVDCLLPSGGLPS